jgi:hypothetical protein
MKYEKPEIVAEAVAIRAIQASFVKATQVEDSICTGGGSGFTDCAYVADE